MATVVALFEEDIDGTFLDLLLDVA
jgi:hypothetical protein